MYIIFSFLGHPNINHFNGFQKGWCFNYPISNPSKRFKPLNMTSQMATIRINTVISRREKEYCEILEL